MLYRLGTACPTAAIQRLNERSKDEILRTPSIRLTSRDNCQSQPSRPVYAEPPCSNSAGRHWSAWSDQSSLRGCFYRLEFTNRCEPSRVELLRRGTSDHRCAWTKHQPNRASDVRLSRDTASKLRASFAYYTAGEHDSSRSGLLGVHSHASRRDHTHSHAFGRCE